MFARVGLSALYQIMVVTKVDNMASYSAYTGKPKMLFPKKVRNQGKGDTLNEF